VTFAHWAAGGVLVLLLGSEVVGIMTFQVAVSNRVALSALEERMDVREKERHQTRDDRLDDVYLRLERIEQQLKAAPASPGK
jgi:hypothetical protein